MHHPLIARGTPIYRQWVAHVSPEVNPWVTPGSPVAIMGCLWNGPWDRPWVAHVSSAVICNDQNAIIRQSFPVRAQGSPVGNAHGSPADLPWIDHESPTGRPCTSHGSLIGHPWFTPGSPMDHPVRLWITHGSFMGNPRIAYGTPVGRPRVSHGPRTDGPWDRAVVVLECLIFFFRKTSYSNTLAKTGFVILSPENGKKYSI